MIAFMSLSMPSVRGVITADEKIVKRHLGKLFKNPRCQVGWNKNVLFGFS